MKVSLRQKILNPDSLILNLCASFGLEEGAQNTYKIKAFVK